MIGKGIAFKTKYRIASFLVMVLAGSLLGFAPSSAATTTTTACVTTKTGAIRILLKGTCKAKIEKKISWKSNGVRGIQGVQGIQGIQGIQGAQGLTGAQGATGAAGVNGNTIWYGTIAPAANIGVAGDFYVNTVTNFWFGPKTTVWPAGISLVGPAGAGATGATGPAGPAGATGPAGPAGATGPAGASGATGAPGQSGYSSLWFTPADLLYGRGSDTSTVASVRIGDYDEEVLDIDQDQTKFFWRGVPKGWGSATSTTWKIFWATDGIGSKVGFDLYTASGTVGARVSPDLVPGCNVGCSSSNQIDPLAAGRLNVTTITLTNELGNTGGITEGGIFHIGFSRASQLFDGTNFIADGLYQGKVYIFGMSVVANF
jgi:hypothetical protein